jgi:hypothetical protein
MQNNNDMAFHYSPLDTTQPTFRLVRFHRALDGLITAKLKLVSLDSNSGNEYSTLSYVWGRRDGKHKISLDGKPFQVLASLYPILNMICDSPNLIALWWWIDFICIDQQDTPGAKIERGVHVLLMGRIYQQSQHTIGWLGSPSDGEALDRTGISAMNFLRVLRNHTRVLESHEKRAAAVENLSGFPGWEAIQQLFLRPWWRRVWTLQEYMMSRVFHFYCGHDHMDRKEFMSAIYSIYLCRKIDENLLPLEAWQPAWNRRRIHMWYKDNHSMSLVSLVAYGSDSQATDPRDRVYALLGLAKDQGLNYKPDYQCSIGEAYTKLVKQFVQTQKSLDIICFAHIFYSQARAASLGPGLPSWVPDWQVQTEAFVVPLMASQSTRNQIGNFRPVKNITLEDDASCYAAAGDTTPYVRFSDDMRFLYCRGVFVDYVDGVGGLTIESRDWTQPSDTLSLQEISLQLDNSSSTFNSTRHAKDSEEALRLLHAISRCLVLGRKDRYLAYPTPPFKFGSDLIDLCMEASQRSAEIPPRFQDWYELNRSLLIGGRSLEELCLAAFSTFDSQITGIVDVSDEVSFYLRFRDTTKYMTRRLVTSELGHIGMGPSRVRKGDRICVLLGCSIPLILRARAGTTSYEVIGECYLDGFMNGEALIPADGYSSHIEEYELS